MTILGDELRARRVALGWSIADMAKHCGSYVCFVQAAQKRSYPLTHGEEREFAKIESVMGNINVDGRLLEFARKTTVDGLPTASATFVFRFWRYVDVAGHDECWLWKGPRNCRGYGNHSIGERAHGPIGSHRASWLIHHGPIPDGLFVCHNCDNPPCVNPSHLFLGAHEDNMDDMVSKNRQARGSKHGRRTKPENTARGNRVWCAKLDAAKVLSILDRYQSGNVTTSDLGKEFDISQGVVSKIIRGKLWSHVEGRPDKATIDGIISNNLSKCHRGESGPSAKLTEELVIALRADFATRTMTNVQIGKKYGVCGSTVADIASGKTWKTVP